MPLMTYHCDGEIEGDDYSGKSLEDVHFEDVVFRKCLFDGTSFKKARFENVTFIGCRFSGCNAEGTKFDNVIFEESKLTGMIFSLIDPRFVCLTFKRVKLVGCNFSDLKLQGLVMRSCTLQGVDFVQTDLSKGDFQESQFKECCFHKAKCDGADFRLAEGFVIDPLTSSLKKAKFSIEGALSLLVGFDILIE